MVIKSVQSQEADLRHRGKDTMLRDELPMINILKSIDQRKE